MLENFRIDSTLPITLAQVEDMMQNMQGLRQQTAIASVTGTIANNPQQILSWTWAGRIHPVQSDFRFPRYCMLIYYLNLVIDLLGFTEVIRVRFGICGGKETQLNNMLHIVNCISMTLIIVPTMFYCQKLGELCRH